jgi:hypothetical protein
MFRHIAIFMVGAAAIANLNAGSIQLQIGGANGLTAGTVTQTVTGGATGSLGEQGYVGDLPPGTSSLTGIAGTPAAPGVPNGEVPGGQLLTSNGVTFAMIDDSANPTANIWISSNSAGNAVTPVVTTDTIQMGIFGVQNVWTMLNDEYGIVGSTTQVVFNFGTTAGVANLPSLAFTLVNGNSIRDAVDCLTSSTTCPAYQTGLSTSTYGTDDATAAAAGAPSVSAFNVWEGTYGGAPGGAYANMTSGDVNLDAQDFSLTGYSNEYLVSMQIIDSNTGIRQNRDVLSAITVGEAPEPSTWLLFATGLGALFFIRRRCESVV